MANGTKQQGQDPIKKIIKKLHFSYKFYTRSYPDITHLDETSARAHFANTGIHEKRFCCIYHFLLEKKPEYAGSISIKKFRKHNKVPKHISPLKTCELILSHLSYGCSSKWDATLFRWTTKRSTIGKHGQIHSWAAQFNHPDLKVLEIGSRCVSSQDLGC